MSSATEKLSDAQLVARMADGDQGALALLYGRYASRLLALGVRMLRDQREAEDVLHDVFLEALRRSSDYSVDRGTVRAWLMVRMRTRCIDRKRTAYARRTVPTAPLDMPEQIDPAVGADRSADHGRLRSALALIPENQQQVLMLGYYEGLSQSEIATRLDVPLGTVKSRVASARAHLKVLLRKGA